MRINKYLSSAGICSRREADKQILAGNVKIDGRTASMGEQVHPGQKVIYRGRAIAAIGEVDRILLAVNKPVGVVSTAEKREKNNIVDFIGYPSRIYPVGRLDKDSSGLIFMTNQGDLANEILRARNRHEKEYLVTVNKKVTSEFLTGMANGVYLKDLHKATRECQVKKTSSRGFRIILTQGLNRQIRRMCGAFGYQVERLERIRILNIKLGDLKPGEYREVEGAEWEKLKKSLKQESE